MPGVASHGHDEVPAARGPGILHQVCDYCRSDVPCCYESERWHVPGERQIVGFGETEMAWRLAHGRGRALEALGRDAEAVEAYSRAVELIETVRGRLREERFRAGYIEDKHDAYIDLSRVLIRLGRQEQALTCAEKLRARSYLDLLSRHQKSSLTAEQRRREAELRQRVRRLQQNIEEELDPSGQPRRQAIEVFTTELSEAEREYERFLSDLMTVDPVLARNWTLAVPSATAIRRELAPQSALLEFVVGDDEVLVFLLTPDSLRTKTVRGRSDMFPPLGRRPPCSVPWAGRTGTQAIRPADPSATDAFGRL